MKSKLFLTVIFLFSLTTYGSAHADFETVIIPKIPHSPIRRLCKPSQDSEFTIGTQKLLNSVKHAVRCGKFEKALDLLEETYMIVEEKYQASKTRRGWCYEKRGCKGGVIYPSIVTKGTCTAADGKSWKRTSPTAGKCKRVN